MIELLSPVGNFESLKAAVQNGADSVYLGASIFSARAFTTNFNLTELKKAIEYAKIRGIKTNLTLNTLIKDEEFEKAIDIATKAYEFGIDAIIVQDLGLAMELIRLFPDLPIHASTQMTVHNLNGALKLQSLGFKRIVLARELSINEIDYICKNINIEVECFIHGALCISYSGQCLFSSMIGGRSGNRGKCAQPCRLPYELLENDKKINSGYLLSTRDLCGLYHIPFMINSGVKCLKIEGRMKSPEYVATVTRIYKKYINLALSEEPYIVEESDFKELMQVFNRGMSSSGHLDTTPNKNLIFKEKPNNMGLFLGKVQKFNATKGLITLKLNENIEIGDTVSLEKETGSYTVSEITENNKNISETKIDQTVTIGRMKGNISVDDNIYKLSSKSLFNLAKESYSKEYRKVALNCKVTIKKNKPISIIVTSGNNLLLYKNLYIEVSSEETPLASINRPLTQDIILNQLSKTSSTPYYFKNVKINLDSNLFLPKLSILNELRRKILQQVEDFAIINCSRTYTNKTTSDIIYKITSNEKNPIILKNTDSPKISVLLNILNKNYDYSKLKNIDNIYIPLKFFANKNFEKILKELTKNFKTYIYMPTIIKGNYNNLFYSYAENAIKDYKIQGFVISNFCNIKLLHQLFNDSKKHSEIIANYTFNIFNIHSIYELKKLNISKFSISPELNKKTINTLCNSHILPSELIVYGKIPLVNMNYCLLSETDKCDPKCEAKCQIGKSYQLKDRLNIKFPIITDNTQTISTIYNSKITSISPKDFSLNFARIDILDETIDEINSIINIVKSGSRLEGSDYTSGNLNREV